MAGTVPLIFSIFVVFLIVLGVLDVITNYEYNRCEMTFMFERPEYLKVPMKKAVIKKFPNYGLYVYGEGHYARLLSDMRMTGIPVLFIPGNAGSYKQVRSLGSVAFRRAIDKQKRYHFNFFSVDLAEEYSGLYGPVLKEQVEFVHLAIKKIFTLYKKAEVQPKTIVLAGHSMGGMIARGLFTLPDFDHQSVNTIFMQATPNQAPVVVLDPEQAQFHQAVNRYWRDYANSTLSHVTLVSSGGGDYDIQVREGLTPLDGIVDEQQGISMSTTHIPMAWVPTDHRCIVWCKQVVLAFVRALFEIVDENKKEITNDKEHRMSVFRHHFLHHPGYAGHMTQAPGEITLDKRLKWTVMTDKVWKWEQEKVTGKQYLAIPVAEGEEEMDHVVVVSNVFENRWVCACELKEDEEQCSKCKDLSSQGYVIPPMNSYKRAIRIDLHQADLENITHIVITVPYSDTRVEIIGERYNQDSNHLLNSVPGLFEILLSYPESVTTGAMTLDLGKGSFYKLKLHGISNIVKVYTASLSASKCKDSKSTDHSGSLLQFHVPWSNEDTYRFVSYGKTGNLTLKLQHAPPPPVVFDPEAMDLNFGPQYDHVELLIYLDPTCHYELKIKASMREMLGQFVRFYAVLMPPFCVAVLLMTLAHQLRALKKDGVCQSALESVYQVKTYVASPFALILQVILQLKVVQPYLIMLNIPPPDVVHLDRQGIWFRGAHVFFILVAYGVVIFQALVVTLVVQFKSRLLGLLLGWLPSPITLLGKGIGVLLCVVSVGVALFVCGPVGVFVPYVICFAQVLRLCYSSRQSEDKDTKSKYHFYMTLFMVWMWLVMLNSPPLLVWGKTISETRMLDVLHSDPSRLICAAAALVFVYLLLMNIPQSGRKTYGVIAFMINILVILMLVFSLVMLHRVTYTVVLSLVMLTVTGSIYELFTGFSSQKASQVKDKPKTE